MSRARTAIALSAGLWAAGCVYSPEGSCDSQADCAADERCDAGVCVARAGTDDGGADPATAATVLWSRLAGAAATTFAADSIGADLAGNVVVAGAVSAVFDFDPGAVATGAFALKRAAADGAALWAASFPTFSHGRFETAVLPGGDVLFAGTAFDPTQLDVLVTPDPRGTLVIGRIDATTGAPVLLAAVDNTHASADLVPAAVAASGSGDLLVAGTGSGDFGCASGDTASHTFAAALSAADGTCRWSRGFATRTISDVEPRDAGDVAVAGLCTPAGAAFDPSGATTCTQGLFVAVLSGADGSTAWLRTTSGTGTVAAARDLAVAPDGRATVVGDASGVVSFGLGGVDFGTAAASFAATWDASGAATTLVRPVEAPYAASPDALAFSRCAYDPSGRLWLAGRYQGAPTLGGARLDACRAPACAAGAFVASLDAAGRMGSLLPLRAAAAPGGGAFVDDLVLHATTGAVSAALRFTGTAGVGGGSWTSAGGDLGVLRLAP